MKKIQIHEIYSMDNSEKIFVSKDAIYIQILEYERKDPYIYSQKLKYLTQIIASIFDFECKMRLQRQRVEMTVLEIKNNFSPNNYYPKSSFVQYKPIDIEEYT